LPGSDRDAFLSGKCGSDAELRAEVESLLAYDAPDGRWISTLVEDAAASVLVGDLAPGSHVGPYRVLREIGRGGMGTVCLAERDDQAYQKQVAIKLVKRGMDIEAVVDRFRHERQILARLDHPYIAKLLDAGSVPDGRPYFVMEYVEGRRITDYCDLHGLSAEQRCELFRKVCDAVGYAHRALVIHRDLKPGNILVGEDGIPKLLDFGIAKVLSAGGEGEAQTLTAAAARMGTPEYASPEQIRGVPVTTAADVFSLGVLLYELLAGERPYSLDTLTPAALERAICEDDPERPSTLDARRLRDRTPSRGLRQLAARLRKPPSRVGAELDNIVLMAMRKEPERRYRSADELSEDVRRYLAGLAVHARGDKFSYRAGKFLRRHRLSVLAAGAAALSLIVGAAVAVREARVADAQRQRAERRLQQMVELANHSLFDIHDTLEKLPGATEARRQIVKTTLDFLDKLRRDGDNDPAVSAALASAYMRIGEVQGRLGDSLGALASYSRAREILQDLTKSRPGDSALERKLLESELDMAAQLGVLNRVLEARALLAEAIPRAEALASRDTGNRDLSALLAGAYREIADQTQRGLPGQAADYARKSVRLAEKLVAGDPGSRSLREQLGQSYETLGLSLELQTGGLPAARSAFEKAVGVWEALSARYPNDAIVRRYLSSSYTNMGDLLGDARRGFYDLRLATAYYRKTVAMAEAASAADPTDTEARRNLSEALFRYGYSMTAPGERAASIEVLRRAVGVAEETHRLDPANADYCMAASYAQRRLGERLRQAGDSAAALAAYNRARELARQLVDAEPRNQSARGALAESDKYTADLLAQSGDRGAIGYMLHAAAQVDAAIQSGEGALPVRVYKPRCQRWLGDIYAVLAGRDSSLAARRDDWKNARAAYARAADEYRSLIGVPGGERYARQLSETERLVADCDRRLK
jgi:serine/threonine protein kinase